MFWMGVVHGCWNLIIDITNFNSIMCKEKCKYLLYLVISINSMVTANFKSHLQSMDMFWVKL
jgi:hypothetical protein